MWDDGNINDPKSGNEYSGTITLTSENSPDLRGKVGIQFLDVPAWSRKVD